jgi:hypothetical protein
MRAGLRSVCAVACLVGAPAAHAEEHAVQRTEHGSVDWTELTVVAEGSGLPPEDAIDRSAARLEAERRAEDDAKARVLQVLKAVAIDADIGGADRLSNERVRLQAEGMLRRCEARTSRFLSDGAVDMTVACPLEGGLAAILLPPLETRTPDPVDGPPSEHTGVVVVVEGEYAPRLAPRIVDDSGQELYGQASVGSNAVRRWGTAAYTKSEAAARAHPRSGDSPVVVSVSSAGNALLAGPEAAQVLRSEGMALREGRVVIVLPAP